MIIQKVHGTKTSKNFDVSVNGYTPLFNLKIKFPMI